MSMPPAGVEAPPQPAGSAALETYESPAAPSAQTPTMPPVSAASSAAGTIVPRAPSVTAEQFIREAMELIDAARPMPLSTSVMINRDEVMTLLDSALAAVPDETRQARWLLRERDEVMAQARVDANMVIDEARSRVAQMVQRTEVVRSAERQARQMLDQASAQTRRRRHEVDEYCERKLAQFASTVDQIQIAVQAARRKLGQRAASPVASPGPGAPASADSPAVQADNAGGAGTAAPAPVQPQPQPPLPPGGGPATHPVVFDQDQT